GGQGGMGASSLDRDFSARQQGFQGFNQRSSFGNAGGMRGGFGGAGGGFRQMGGFGGRGGGFGGRGGGRR
ncbi:MAG: PE-PGRS family protein, partial [Gammaproteobacteria bacterium]